MLVTVTIKSNLYRDQIVMGNSTEPRLCALVGLVGTPLCSPTPSWLSQNKAVQLTLQWGLYAKPLP